jgi:hypothetical protein
MNRPNDYACLEAMPVKRGGNSLHSDFHCTAGRPRWFALFFLAFFAFFLNSCGGGSGGSTITIEVQPNGVISVDEGGQVIFNATLGGDTQNKGLTWSFTGTGCAGTGCGTLSSTTAPMMTYTAPTGLSTNLTVSLKVVANGNSAATATITINVVLPPKFQTPAQVLPNGSNGVAYNAQIIATGGVAPLTFSLASGSIPEGLHLNTNGSIVGRPTGPGPGPNPAVFTVQVTDSPTAGTAIAVVSPQFSISISPAPTLTITSSGALTPAIEHTNYSTHITTSGGVPPFRWSIPPGTLPPGLSLDVNSGVISGVPTVANMFMFTPTVQDSSIPMQVVSTPMPLSITVSAPPPLLITTASLPDGQTVTPYTASVTATGGVAPYFWSVITGQLPSGLVLNASTGQISGTPVLTITSATISNFTLQVTDSQIPSPKTLSKDYSIKITAGATNPDNLLKGSYSFLFQGYDAQGPVIATGTIIANGSGGLSGREDLNRKPGVNSVINSNASLTGTYSLGTDGRGTMTITSINNLLQVLVSEYQLVIDSDGNARFFENDANNTTPPMPSIHGSGILKRQSGSNFAAANFSGNYALSFTGRDFGGTPSALVGFIHADGNQTLSPGLVDVNDAAAYSPGVPLSGNFSVSGATGRGVASLVFAVPGSAQSTLGFVFYFVSPTNLFFVTSDITDSTHPLLAGELVAQNPATKFDQSALSGPSVTNGTGLDANNSSAFVGRLLTADPACAGAFSISLNMNQNDGGAITAPAPSCGSYLVDSNGHVTFTNLGSRVSAAYLTDRNTAFLIGGDPAATTGLIEPQTGAPFALNSIQGGYTLSAPFTSEGNVKSLLGQFSCETGNGVMAGTLDEVDADGTPHTISTTADLTFTLTDAPRGRGTLTTNTALVPATLAFYIVSPSKVRLISTDPADQHPEVIFLDH